MSEIVVDFDTCNIREHEYELGNKPSCSSGTPVTLGWNFIAIGAFPFKEFKMNRSKLCDELDKSVHGRRGSSVENTVLTRIAQEKLLMGHAFPHKEIAEAMRNNI